MSRDNTSHGGPPPAAAAPQIEAVAYLRHYRPAEGGEELDLIWAHECDEDLDGELYHCEPLVRLSDVSSGCAHCVHAASGKTADELWAEVQRLEAALSATRWD